MNKTVSSVSLLDELLAGLETGGVWTGFGRQHPAAGKRPHYFDRLGQSVSANCECHSVYVSSSGWLSKLPPAGSTPRVHVAARSIVQCIWDDVWAVFSRWTWRDATRHGAWNARGECGAQWPVVRWAEPALHLIYALSGITTPARTIFTARQKVGFSASSCLLLPHSGHFVCLFLLTN